MNRNIGQLGGLMKEAQKMQAQIKEVQERLAEQSVEGSAGGGMVVATVNGRQEVLSVKIDPEVLSAHDPDMLQDLIVAAVNQALKNSQELMQQEMGKITGKMGMNFPGMGM